MSQVNTKTVLLGSNADQSKNFKITVPTPEDGTLTIERANGTDVMKFLANGGVDMPSLPFSKTQSGYVTLPNGIIIQWGTSEGLIVPNGAKTISFPTTFPNTALVATVTAIGGTQATSPTSAQIRSLSVTGIGIGNTGLSDMNFQWIAIGY